MRSIQELAADSLALCHAIEFIPAGEEQTAASVRAAQLNQGLQELLATIQNMNQATKMYPEKP
jgi:hypothetical protein